MGKTGRQLDDSVIRNPGNAATALRTLTPVQVSRIAIAPTTGGFLCAGLQQLIDIIQSIPETGNPAIDDNLGIAEDAIGAVQTALGCP